MHALSLFGLSFLPSLLKCAITATSAIALTPSLLEHSDKLEDALAEYKNAHIQIAAIKLKSLLPSTQNIVTDELKAQKKQKNENENETDSDSDDEEKSSNKENNNENDAEDDDDDSSDVEEVPNSTTFLLIPFKNLLKQLETPVADKISSFDFSQQSLDDFVAAKEQEATQKLQESLTAIREIQRVLQAHPSNKTSQVISSKLLARLIAKMDALQEEYDEIQTLEKRLKSSKAEKRLKAKNELVNSQVKIQKIVQRLSEIVSE